MQSLHRTDSQVSGLLSPLRKSMEDGPQRTKPVLCYIAPAGSEVVGEGRTFDFSTVCDAVSRLAVLGLSAATSRCLSCAKTLSRNHLTTAPSWETGEGGHPG